jgi:hypothetical protein
MSNQLKHEQMYLKFVWQPAPFQSPCVRFTIKKWAYFSHTLEA